MNQIEKIQMPRSELHSGKETHVGVTAKAELDLGRRTESTSQVRSAVQMLSTRAGPRRGQPEQDEREEEGR